MSRSNALICLFYVALVSPATAETIVPNDASQKIMAMLQSLGAKPVEKHKTIQDHILHCPPPRMRLIDGATCTDEMVEKDQIYTEQQILIASNIKTSRISPLIFSPINKKNIPDQIISNVVYFYNCSTNLMPTEATQLSVQFQRTSQMQVSQTYTNGSSAQESFSFKLSDSLTIGGQLQVNASETHGTIDSNSYAQTVNRSVNHQFVLGKRSAAAAQTTTFPVLYQANFKTLAIVDADLSDKRRLSDYFSEEDRSLPISGTIEFTDAAEGVGSVYDITFDETKCPLEPSSSVVILSPNR